MNEENLKPYTEFLDDFGKYNETKRIIDRLIKMDNNIKYNIKDEKLKNNLFEAIWALL